ncbi:3-hydroxyacyl-CoA dehydrogenase PaaC [Pseudomonas mosselii]|uniref:3-hydroxyacyl-CoA dehydrogenase PaaH n=1 Tax=unclassified Pseudomonas TaxID=196821 RepID=UPI0020C26441|nr:MULTISPECIES: 3-hydroxyacyl-CoA dehydrogenase PaaH [unclassified Pseudomonas]MCP8632042.1 3-hydroxyacyl-CoA dehydrogenase PaaC [Pseudomonas sp. DVZ6]MDC0690840.1 3-hydroxyacyl-CoA dehydrogenase PaaC [Mitsuaria sp. RG]MDD7783130.1 3-hydroxyacyl-CoA dehydrogenase PaaC [Pseudomonas sp. DVZ24]
MAALDNDALVAVIGAGAMGAGIAQVAAQAGHPVRLYDNRPGAAAQAIEGIDRQLGRLVEKGRLTPDTRSTIRARLQPIDSLDDLADARLVIEAIVESLPIKQELLRQLEARCADDCILASNTSSLSITSLAAGLRHPQRVIGMHFFNPAPLMALVEVVSGLATAPTLASTLYDTARNWGKQPVHTRSTPGFIVNRVARPFYAESLRLLQEGAADCATLDALLRDAGGFRMGAFELTDLIGHDVNYAVTCSVFEAFYGDFRFQPSLVQKELVDAGRLGRKTGQGFYSYAEGAERPAPAALTSQAPVERCTVEGDLGVLRPLVERLRAKGIDVTERAGGGLLRVGDATLALSDGRLASQRAREDGLRNLVLLDLALDYTSATRLAISHGAECSAEALDQAVDLLARAGLSACPVADLPGLVVLRTVAMLANEAADAVLQGVGTPGDIDLAMRAGVNYPRGPLAWADDLGVGYTLNVLDNLQRSYGEERYRPSLLLRRTHAEGGCLHD